MRFRFAALFLVAVSCKAAGDAHRRRGMGYLAENRLNEALTELRLAVSAEPANARTRALLGRLELRAGRPGAALRELEAAHELGDGSVDRELAELFLARARARAVLGQRAAWRDFDRACALDQRLPERVKTFAGERAQAFRSGNNDRAVLATVEPDVPAELSLAQALRDWLLGKRDSWIDEELVLKVAWQANDHDPDAWPDWSRPTVLRLLGDFAEAEAALGALDRPMPPPGNAVVSLELALAFPYRLPPEPEPRDDVSSWLLRVLVARRSHSVEEGESLIRLAQASDEAAPILVRRLDVAPLLVLSHGPRPWAEQLSQAMARWWWAVRELGPEATARLIARWQTLVPAGSLDSWMTRVEAHPRPALGEDRERPLKVPSGCETSPEAAAAHANMQRAYRADPGAADVAARELVDGDLVPQCRGLAVLRFYSAMGDVARALSWAEELLAVEPGDQEVLGLAVRLAPEPRALLLVEQAEVWADERGVPSLAATDAFLAAGRPIAAIGAARRALGLAQGTRRREAFEALTAAALTAGREADGRGAFAAYLRELPAERHDEARFRVRRRLRADAVAVPHWLASANPAARERALAAGGELLEAWVGAVPMDSEAAVALARSRAAPGGAPDAALEVLARCLEWNPWSIGAMTAVGEIAPASSATLRDALGRLLLIGLVDEGERGTLALGAALGVAERAFLLRLARGIRAELMLRD